mgnify:CR=1 FL=1
MTAKDTFKTIDELAQALQGVGYFAERRLITAVFLSLKLERPLLLEGEPGVGDQHDRRAHHVQADAQEKVHALLSAQHGMVHQKAYGLVLQGKPVIGEDKKEAELVVKLRAFPYLHLPEPHKAPAITRPWPSKYLVPECTIKSAPMAMGRCKIGVAKQLSIINKRLCFLAILPNTSKSIISTAGFVGDSA